MTGLPERYITEPNCGCWIWTGSLMSDGYGRFDIRRKMYSAHRISYEVHKGPIPHGMQIRHSCDIPACVNPDHLDVGTPRDNFNDMLSRKRGHWQSGNSRAGENNQNAKLKRSDIPVIRQLIANGLSAPKIAVRYGVTASTINRVRSGRSWANV